MAEAERIEALPLFPLRTVLFPGGLLALKVFEARYLDLVAECLRRGRPFGVVCLVHGTEVRDAAAPPVRFEPIGVLARLLEVDSEHAGVLQVRCIGGRRFRLDGAAVQQADGLWLGRAALLADDACVAPVAALRASVQALDEAITTLRARGSLPFALPHRLDDTGWVANRWCEILPLTLADKQALMALDDPLQRLQRVHDYLRAKGVVAA
jgi:Lon protease-like protein